MLPRARHSIQLILTAMQCGMILIGTMLTKHTLNVRGFPDPAIPWHPLPVFLRGYSFLLLSIPVLWALYTIWLERTQSISRGYVAISGLLTLAGTCFIFFAAILLAAGVVGNL